MQGLLFTFIIILTTIISGGTQSQTTSDVGQANELFVEAVESIERAEAEGVSLEEKVRLYQQAVDNFEKIIKEYRSTDLAVKLISDQRIGKIQKSEVEEKLQEAQAAYRIEKIEEDVRNFSGKLVWIRGGRNVSSVAYSPDGRHIASSGGNDNKARVWDADTGELRHTLTGHRVGVTSVGYSPDGRHIASGSQGKTVRVWELWE